MMMVAPQAPSSFHSHFSSIRTFFIVSLLVFITVNGVGAVRALAMFWCVCACQKLPFPKNMPPEKPKWCVEDDEDVGEEVPYLCPVAGLATGEGVEVSFFRATSL